MTTAPIYAFEDTWNDSGTTFNAIKVDVTDGASASDSTLIDLQVGSTSQFKVNKGGIITAKGFLADGNVDLQGNRLVLDADNDSYIEVNGDDSVSIYISGTEILKFDGSADDKLILDGVSFAPTGAAVGQALGYPNSTTTLEPYTPAGGGDTLKAADETITGDWDFTGALLWNGVQVVDLSSAQTLTNKTLTSPTVSGGSATNLTSFSVGVASPDGTAHIASGSAGTITASTSADELVIEGASASNVGMSILSPNTASGNIFFGDEDNNARGRIVYDHSNDSFDFLTAGSSALTLTAGGAATFGDPTTTRQGLSVYDTAVENYTALKALTAGAFRIVLVADAKRGGLFIWDASDLSDEVTLDVSEGVYVPPDSDATGASGCWVRLITTYITPFMFGAEGDSSTDDAPAIQDALDFGEDFDKAVFFPACEPRPSGARGFYNCESTLVLADGSTLIGEGPWRSEIRFTNDTNGFSLKDAPSNQFTTNLYMQGLHLRGNADVSSSATATVGLLLEYINHSTFKNIWMQDWVDAIKVDAGDVGAVMTVFDRVEISMLKSPNETNSYPRYGITLDGNTKKPQGIVWSDSCRVYAEESVQEQDYNGDGATVNFDIDLTAKGGLYRTEGLQVYVVNATTGEPELQVEGTDYDLFDITSGSEVAITTGDTYTGADEVRVKFTSAPASGTNNVRLYWSDPTGAVGIRVLEGSGNYFGGLVGGWDINCYVNDQQNICKFIYSQIARVSIQLTANASQCTALVGERTDASIYEKHVDINSSAVNPVVLQGVPAFTEKFSGANQSVTGTTATTMALSGDDYVQISVLNPGSWREVEAEIDLLVENTGASARADVDLQYSHDNGNTWTTLLNRRVQATATSVSGVDIRTTVRMRAFDKTYLHPSRGNLKQPRYRVQVSGVTGSDSWTIYGGGNTESFIRAREINPA